jgi:hypothetical protein
MIPERIFIGRIVGPFANLFREGDTSPLYIPLAFYIKWNKLPGLGLKRAR